MWSNEIRSILVRAMVMLGSIAAIAFLGPIGANYDMGHSALRAAMMISLFGYPTECVPSPAGDA